MIIVPCCRFLPDGTFLYRTSPEVLSKVERSLRTPFVRSRGDEGVQRGRYLLLVRTHPRWRAVLMSPLWRLASPLSVAGNAFGGYSMGQARRGDPPGLMRARIRELLIERVLEGCVAVGPEHPGGGE
jgi:hypothetical protein